MEPYLEQYTEEEVREIRKIQSERVFLGQHPRMMGTCAIMHFIAQIVSWTVNGVLLYYLYAGTEKGGLGLPQTEAIQITLMTAPLLVIAGLIGSFTCDRILGPRKSMRYTRVFGITMYLLLAFGGVPGYFAYIVLNIISTCIGGQAWTLLITRLYQDGDKRREAAWSILYVVQNVGAIIPFVAGTLSDQFGYKIVFAVSASFLIISNTLYLVTERKFFGPIGTRPDNPLPADKRTAIIVKFVAGIVTSGAILGGLFATGLLTINSFASAMSTIGLGLPVVYFIYIYTNKKTTKFERGRILAVIPAFVANAMTLLVWAQATTILAIYADTTVDRNFFGFELHPTIFSTIGGIFSVVFGIILTTLWSRLGKHQPSPMRKVGIGTTLWALGPIFMCIPLALFPAGIKVSPLWLIGFYFIVILGEAFAYPVSTMLPGAVAPAAFASQFVTVWGMGGTASASVTSVIVNFYTPGNEVPYFMAIGGATLVVALGCFLFAKRLDHKMGLDAAVTNEIAEAEPVTAGAAEDIASVTAGEQTLAEAEPAILEAQQQAQDGSPASD